MSRKPVIGVPCRIQLPANPMLAPMVGIGENYPKALLAAGGYSVLMPPNEDVEGAREFLELCDGLMLTGGADIHPSRYGEAPLEVQGGPEHLRELLTFDPTRDALEFRLLERARELRMPVLGLCRGMQVMWVAYGGSLIQDISTQVEHALKHMFVGGERRNDASIRSDMSFWSATPHSINIKAGTRFHQIMGGETFNVNTFHHQAARQSQLDGLTVCATAPDGIVEAVEGADPAHFMLGVEFHPEILINHGHGYWLQPFVAFVQAARRFREARTW